MKRSFACLMTVVIFTILCGCSSEGYQSPDYVKIADNITEKTAKNLQAQKHLYLIGTGGGMMHDIQAMHMSFQYFQEVDLTTARNLMVYAINEYLLAINSNEQIRPYLHNYPFTAKNLEMRIWIYNPDRSKPTHGKINYISAIDGVINYYTDTTEKYNRKSICTEIYEDALKKVDEGK